MLIYSASENVCFWLGVTRSEPSLLWWSSDLWPFAFQGYQTFQAFQAKNAWNGRKCFMFVGQFWFWICNMKTTQISYFQYVTFIIKEYKFCCQVTSATPERYLGCRVSKLWCALRHHTGVRYTFHIKITRDWWNKMLPFFYRVSLMWWVRGDSVIGRAVSPDKVDKIRPSPEVTRCPIASQWTLISEKAAFETGRPVVKQTFR